MDACMDACRDAWMHALMHGCMHGCMDACTDAWMNAFLYVCAHLRKLAGFGTVSSFLYLQPYLQLFFLWVMFILSFLSKSDIPKLSMMVSLVPSIGSHPVVSTGDPH